MAREVGLGAALLNAQKALKNKISNESIEIIEKFEKNPTKENYNKLELNIINEKEITIQQKNDFLNNAKTYLLDICYFNDYQNMELEDIEKDIVELKTIGNMAVYLIGDRLLHVQSEYDIGKGKKSEKIKQEYGTFEKYIETRLKISKQSAYFYIAIAKYIKEVSARRLIEPSKLKPYLTIFKQIDESDRGDKEELLNTVIKESIDFVQKHTFREVEEIARKKKEELGFVVKKQEDKSFFRNNINKFFESLPESLSRDEKVELEYLIVRLQKLLDK